MTLVFCWIPLDLWIAQGFYEREKVFWSGYGRDPWRTIDRLSVYPGMIVGVSAILYSVGAFLFLAPAFRCRGMLLIACIFLTGPGLLVNCTMKPAFSRPRPRDVVHESAGLRYLPPLTPGSQFYWNSSFPSGHAAIGYFAFLAPAFALRNRGIWRRSLLAAGLIYGSLIGYSRMIQGGHFLSDIVWSLAIIYFVGWAMTAVMERRNLIPTPETRSCAYASDGA